MKIHCSSNSVRRRSESGLAIVVILVLLLIMSVYVVANSLTLHSLKQELNRVERQQERRWQIDPVSRTNAPVTAIPKS